MLVELELNDLLLNEIVHIILFLILAVMYVNTLIDRKIESGERNRDFSMFVLSCAVYVGLMLIWLPIRDTDIPWGLRIVLYYVRVFFAALAYYFIGNWIISIIEKNMEAGETISLYIKKLMHYAVYMLYLLFCLLLFFTHEIVISNIPILIYYLMLEGIILYYHKALGKLYATIITMFIIPMMLLQAQEWWNYTPANIYLVLAILVIYSRMWLDQRQIYLKNEKRLVQYKTEVMLSQISPHFIYNTLSTIAALCTADPQRAQKLTIDFTGYLRNDLNLAGMQQLSDFKTELGHAKKYLEIEQVRFGKRLNVEFDIREMDFRLPSLSLQPIVENAVKHGVTRKPSGGTVRISTEKRGEFYAVIVADDGVGCTAADLEPKEGHYGLFTTRERLKILLDGKFSVESVLNQGTTVTMLVKISEGVDEDEDSCC